MLRVLDMTPHHTAIEPLMQLLSLASRRKKKVYKQAVEDRRGTFTPFVHSMDELL